MSASTTASGPSTTPAVLDGPTRARQWFEAVIPGQLAPGCPEMVSMLSHGRLWRRIEWRFEALGW